ncbi:MAG: aldehyde dehydrogenase family protein, partial [Deltaproteobacteria bacterium]
MSPLVLKDPGLFRQHCLIDGEWVGAAGKEVIAVTNPASGETLGHVPNLGGEQTGQAILAAHRALSGWRRKTAQERATILRNWFQLLLANQEDLAMLMTAEQGKPLAEARGEIA